MGDANIVLSVIIVTYNSRSDLELCLPSLLEQEIRQEIMVVDNCSTDDTLAWLQQTHPGVRIAALGENLGYAAGNNVGIRKARGHYVLVLNPDTVVHTGGLSELVRAAESHPRAFITPKLLQQDGSINACGNSMHYSGITTCTGMGWDPALYRGIHDSFLLSGAAILASRDAWLDVGGFDEQFFLYMEDTDLSLRARLRGYEILCAADAIVTHRYRLNMTPKKFYYLERNRLLMLLKAYESPTLRKALPSLLLTELAIWMYASTKGPAYLAARWSGYRWLWEQRREWQKARTAIQRSRQVPDSYLVSRTACALPYRQLISQPRTAQILERITTPLYQCLRP